MKCWHWQVEWGPLCQPRRRRLDVAPLLHLLHLWEQELSTSVLLFCRQMANECSDGSLLAMCLICTWGNRNEGREVDVTELSRNVGGRSHDIQDLLWVLCRGNDKVGTEYSRHQIKQSDHINSHDRSLINQQIWKFLHWRWPLKFVKCLRRRR